MTAFLLLIVHDSFQIRANSSPNITFWRMVRKAEDAGRETMILRVTDNTGDEMFFRVKKSTKMQACSRCCHPRDLIPILPALFPLVANVVILTATACLSPFIIFYFTIFQKILDAYAQRKGIATTWLSLIVNSVKVAGNQTPKSLDLNENDQIYDFIENDEIYVHLECVRS